MLELTDTHCHIHEAEQGYDFNTEAKKKYLKAGSPSPDSFIAHARETGVNQLLCVGTTLEDSELAVDFVQSRPGTWASIGIHPHEAKRFLKDPEAPKRFELLIQKAKVVAVGECGLDFYYNHSPRAEQEEVLRFQIELALAQDLPLIFHVRSAFEEFWPIFDSYAGIRGVVHSFSSSRHDLDQILQRNLYVGLNGITTFMKSDDQLAAIRAVPLENMVLETDAPFLTPAPHRGTMCEPKHVRNTAEFLAHLRGESLDTLANRTNINVQKLFRLKEK